MDTILLSLSDLNFEVYSTQKVFDLWALVDHMALDQLIPSLTNWPPGWPTVSDVKTKYISIFLDIFIAS